MKVILDTTIFHSDPYFRNTEMIVFRNLCKDGKVELVIPNIVLQEFKTQEIEKIIPAGIDYIDKLKNQLMKTECETIKNNLVEIIANMELVVEKTREIIETRINTFINETNAIILKTTIDEYDKTFDSYFKGEKPFKQIKSREDIPDGIIYTQIISLNNRDIIFITKDKKLKEAVELHKITVYSNLNDFIKTDIIKKIAESRKYDEIITNNFLKLIENKMMLDLFYSALENELLNKKVEDSRIPDDNNEGIISGVMGIDPIEFTKQEIEKLGEGIYTIPFYCEIDATLEYFLFKEDYYCYDEDRMRDIYIEDWNDHYWQAEENYPLICTGNLGIQFNMDNIIEITDSNQEDFLEEIKLTFSNLEIQVKEY